MPPFFTPQVSRNSFFREAGGCQCVSVCAHIVYMGYSFILWPRFEGEPNRGHERHGPPSGAGVMCNLNTGAHRHSQPSRRHYYAYAQPKRPHKGAHAQKQCMHAHTPSKKKWIIKITQNVTSRMEYLSDTPEPAPLHHAHAHELYHCLVLPKMAKSWHVNTHNNMPTVSALSNICAFDLILAVVAQHTWQLYTHTHMWIHSGVRLPKVKVKDLFSVVTA